MLLFLLSDSIFPRWRSWISLLTFFFTLAKLLLSRPVIGLNSPRRSPCKFNVLFIFLAFFCLFLISLTFPRRFFFVFLYFIILFEHFLSLLPTSQPLFFHTPDGAHTARSQKEAAAQNLSCAFPHEGCTTRLLHIRDHHTK